MLIVKHAHKQDHHAGTNQVLAQLSVQYWIISAREAIREWERECMQCRRRKASPVKQVLSRKKWRRDQPNLKVGDVVIVMSTETPRGKWPLGRIIKVFPGKDDQGRVVHVQVGKMVYRRPVVKLCPLEQC